VFTVMKALNLFSCMTVNFSRTLLHGINGVIPSADNLCIKNRVNRLVTAQICGTNSCQTSKKNMARMQLFNDIKRNKPFKQCDNYKRI